MDKTLIKYLKNKKTCDLQQSQHKPEGFKIEVSFNPCSSTALILLRLQFVTQKKRSLQDYPNDAATI